MPAVYQHFGEAPGRHADWLEVALLRQLLGPGLLDGREEAFARHARAQGPTRFPLVGIPIERRGSDGVLGKGWLAGRSVEDLSRDAWNVFLPAFVSRLEADIAGAGAYLWPATWDRIG
jgi:hypothetical protein